MGRSCTMTGMLRISMKKYNGYQMWTEETPTVSNCVSNID